MRLIDADKLHYIRKWFEDSGKSEVVVFAKEIDKAPTVKAIPVEWIKNYARHKASKGFTEIDCYWQSWEDDVLKMVTAWEKENETN